MARTVADLPAGTRVTDDVSLGVLAKTFPRAQIGAVLLVLPHLRPGMLCGSEDPRYGCSTRGARGGLKTRATSC